MNYPQEHIKPYGKDGKKSEQVKEMFDNIAPFTTNSIILCPWV